MASQTHINAFTDISRFSSLKNEAGKNPSDAVGKVAKEFEALFIEMMLSSARKAAIKGGMFESHALELYKEMFDTQAARVLSEQGTLGFERAISQFAGIQAEAEPTQSSPGAHFYNGGSELVTGSTKASQGLENDFPLELPARRADLPITIINKQSPQNQHLEKVKSVNAVASTKKILSLERPISGAGNQRIGPTDQYSFSQAIAPYASEAAQKIGVEPSILIAQAALETGWGAHVIPGEAGTSSNNLFGIKANNRWQGEASEVTTLEFLGGRPIHTKASFRRYPDIQSAFDDYVGFVKNNPRYQKALANAGNADNYIRELAKAGYATDPKYAEKIISIKNRIENMNMLVDATPTASNTSPSVTINTVPDVEN